MKKVSMNMGNVREKDQLERMHRLQKEKRCFFCDENYTHIGASPAVYTSKLWYIKKNDYPYKGSVHHYLIVPKNHIQTISEFPSASWKELQKAILWLEKKTKVTGYSVFVRSGDMRYTGATLDHLHFHFLVGGKSGGKTRLENNLLVTLGHKKK
jgi:ATP adenylyltransferase